MVSALGVELVDGHAGAVFVVLAQVRDTAAGRADVADLWRCRRRQAEQAMADAATSLKFIERWPCGRRSSL
jgi:hypothetical protein